MTIGRFKTVKAGSIGKDLKSILVQALNEYTRSIPKWVESPDTRQPVLDKYGKKERRPLTAEELRSIRDMTKAIRDMHLEDVEKRVKELEQGPKQ